MNKSTRESPDAPLQDNSPTLDEAKSSNNASVNRPDSTLLALIKARLKPDFYRDPFDPPKWQGTPALKETVRVPQKKSGSVASNDPYFRITPANFRGYELKLMSPPAADNQIAKRTLYLECENDELICTVCDSHRAITESVIKTSELRKLGVNITIPLNSAEITPLVPQILTILKICDLKEEKQNLANKTQEKNQPDYLEKYCESLVTQVYKEQTIMSQMMRRNLAPDNPIKHKYEAIDKEISDFLDFIRPDKLVNFVQGVCDASKGRHTKLDIIVVVTNILNDKIEGFSQITAALKKEVIQQSVQQEAGKPLPKWTHREDHAAAESKNSNAEEFEKKSQEDNDSKEFHF